MDDETKLVQKIPSLARNYISFIGAAIALASLSSIVLLLLLELLQTTNAAYLGIFAYVILPSVLVCGLAVFGAGMLLERRRRRRFSPEEIAAFPKIDFNNPHSRRTFFSFIGLSMIFVFMSAFGSYRAYEHTESVAFCGQTCHETMKPEFVAYGVSPHARVRCVECHVGSGAESYARSKITGAYQLYAVAFNKVPKPITTPVHNMRPARDTCEQCHWPSKFYGNEFKTFSHYGYDEQNSLRSVRMLINVGGGDPASGPVAGIHWHMNIANEITYISSDDHRQVIPWVRIKDRQGNITEYIDRNRPPSSEQLAKAESRRMDCIDCHNRPAHTFLPPDVAVDQSFAAGRLDASLPYFNARQLQFSADRTTQLTKLWRQFPRAWISSIAPTMLIFIQARMTQSSPSPKRFSAFFKPTSFPKGRPIGRRIPTTSDIFIPRAVFAVMMASM